MNSKSKDKCPIELLKRLKITSNYMTSKIILAQFYLLKEN